MTAHEILKQIKGLTTDKLTYFVRAGYIQPTKIKRSTLLYNEFTEKDLELIRRAWHYIVTYDMKTRSAFLRAEEELKASQLELFQRM